MRKTMGCFCFNFILLIIISSDIPVTGLSINDPGTINASKISLGFVDNVDSIGYSRPCLRKANCTSFQNETCFGHPFTYSSTSFPINDTFWAFLHERMSNLSSEAIKINTTCFFFLKPLICALSRPKCYDGEAYLPSQELCHKAKNACIRYKYRLPWDVILNCEDEELFPKCRIQTKLIPWKKYECAPPFIKTSIRENWVQDMAGCGLQCKNSFYTEEEHSMIFVTVLTFAIITFISTLFALGTALLHSEFREYPFLQIKYILQALVIISLGWIIQIFPGAHRSITCLSDNTLRTAKLGYTDGLCILTFLMIYFFGTRAIVCFVGLSYIYYAWSKSRPFPLIVNKKITFLKWSAWIIPCIYTSGFFFTEQISGDPLSGICSIGLHDPIIQTYFIAVPVFCAFLIAGVFFSLAVGLTVAVLGIFRSVFIGVYYYLSQKKWMPTPEDYNNVNNGVALELSLESKQSILIPYFQLNTYFFGLWLLIFLLVPEFSIELWKKFVMRVYERCKNGFTSLRAYVTNIMSLNVPTSAVHFQRNLSACTVHQADSNFYEHRMGTK